MFSHLQSMFGNLGCYTVFPQHIWFKSKFKQITLSVMCFSKLCDLADNCDCDQAGWGSFLLDEILTKESFGSGARRFIWWEQGLVRLWKLNKFFNFRWSIFLALPVGVGGAMISVQIFLVISCKGANSYKSHGSRGLTHKRKVYLFIYQVKLCDEVVEVFVAGVHMRFRTWKNLILRRCYLGSKESKASANDLIKSNQINTYRHDPIKVVHINVDEYPVEPKNTTECWTYFTFWAHLPQGIPGEDLLTLGLESFWEWDISGNLKDNMMQFQKIIKLTGKSASSLIWVST